MSRGYMNHQKKLLIKSGLHRMLKGKPTTAFGEDSARSKVSKSTI